jgi:hypothetical protein
MVAASLFRSSKGLPSRLRILVGTEYSFVSTRSGMTSEETDQHRRCFLHCHKITRMPKQKAATSTLPKLSTCEIKAIQRSVAKKLSDLDYTELPILQHFLVYIKPTARKDLILTSLSGDFPCALLDLTGLPTTGQLTSFEDEQRKFRTLRCCLTESVCLVCLFDSSYRL